MYCWGDGSSGQLGVHLRSNEIVISIPKVVNMHRERISKIACGEKHTMFLTANGTILTCGRNSKGQLGRTKNNGATLPVAVKGLPAIVGVACGREHCLALCESGQVFSWGRGSEGQLGGGEILTKVAKPRKVVIPSPMQILVVQIACGNHHSLALTKGGEVFAWGQNSHGQLGLGKSVLCQKIPAPVHYLTGVPVAQICAGGAYSLALSLSGQVYCCGANDKGQLGLNRVDEKGRFVVLAVPALRLLRVSSMSCGEAHTTVITKDGEVFTFGEGSCGQLGHNSTADELKPRKVESIDGEAAQIACGSRHTLVLMSSGQLLAFGSGLKGQLGNGSVDNCSQPSLVQQAWRSAGPLSTSGMKIFSGWNTSFIYTETAEDKEETPATFCRFPFVQNLESKMIAFKAVVYETMRTPAIELLMRHHGNLWPNYLLSGMWPSEARFTLNLNRITLLEDTFRQLSMADHENFRKKLVVDFVDDLKPTLLNVGDFFLHIFKQLFAPDSDMFMYDDSNTLAWFPVKPVHPEKRYFLLGVLCGMALYNNNRVDLPFPLALFKKLLNVKPTLEDLEELSPVLGTSLRHTLDYSDEVIKKADMYFSVYWNGVEVALDPTEEEKVVTGANKKDFVNASVDYILNKSVEKVFEEFKRGFFKVCDADVMTLFQPEELMGVMLGSEAYNWEVLKQNTVYEGEYHAKHPNIVMFWEVFEEMLEDQKKAFLLFLTGFKRVPILGMDTIRMRVAVLANSSREHYPESLTCHFLLLLPIYQSRKLLRARLIEALNHNTGFWKD